METQVPERDDRYRATQNRWIVAGQGTFRMATSYDAADRVTQLQYPADNNDGLREIVERSYNPVGQLDQVMSLMDGTPFIDATSYLANGQIASQRFDQSSYGLLREYTYDDVGNLVRILDDVNSGQQQCFGYDQLDQLTRAFTGDGTCTSYSATGIRSQ
jgi:YD repeat-containing protein